MSKKELSKVPPASEITRLQLFCYTRFVRLRRDDKYELVTSGIVIRSLLSRYPLLPLSRCWNLLYSFLRFDLERSVSTLSWLSSSGVRPDFELKTIPIFFLLGFVFRIQSPFLMSTWCFFFSFSWNELKLNKLFWILNTLLLTICFHFSSQLKKWEKRSYWFLNYQDFLQKPISGKFLFWYCVNESVLLLYIDNLCSRAK